MVGVKVAFLFYSNNQLASDILQSENPVNSIPQKVFSFEGLCRHASSRPSPPTADASRDPDNVPAKAGNKKPNEVIELSLDSGSRPL